MKSGILSAMVFGLALGAACAQETNPATSPQTPGAGQGGWQSPNGGGRPMGQGRGMGMGAGRGLQGTVTEVAADHYMIKTDAGDVYTVSFSANTRIMKQPAERQGPGEGRQAGDYQRPAPQILKPTDIKVGDPIAAIGQVDSAAKSVGAVVVLLIDPERAKQMREMQANYGKTWLQGKVTAISGVSVTVQGSLDNAAHTFVANETTTFRKRRDPITLADIQVGDMMRVEGALKDGTFVAARVMVMGMPPMSNVPRTTDNQPHAPQTSTPETQPK